MLGTLYIVATPIGNLEDITFRAIKVLFDVDIILAEDTRSTGKLLSLLNAKKANAKFGNITNSELRIANLRLLSYHHHSSESRKAEILALLQEGKNIALVTDAGTPGISDPGNELIDFLLEQDPAITVVPVPGVSALTAALSVSGFRADKFIFVGFLPKKKRLKLFTWLKESKMTFAFFDSPHRLHKTFADLKEHFGEGVRISIARELTKMHETLYRGMLSDVENSIPEKVKGEVVVIVESV